MKPLAYLMKQFSTGFANEWKSLSDKDKEELKNYAIEEMKELGITVI